MSIWCFEQMSGAVSNEKTMTQGWKTLDLRTLFFFFLKYSVEFLRNFRLMSTNVLRMSTPYAHILSLALSWIFISSRMHIQGN